MRHFVNYLCMATVNWNPKKRFIKESCNGRTDETYYTIGYPFTLLKIDFVLTKRIEYRTLIILIFEIRAPFFSRNTTVMVNDWL